LQFIAPREREITLLGYGFNAFGDDRNAQYVREIDDQFDDFAMSGRGVIVQIGRERAIHLELIDW
jgi:hypothetical protein